ncbi:hypothetical protein E4T39_00735 [Aureobasidium subglaciale]|nr:hypothetical protein E4T39_00735 [Aureobasidium subglaciale]
MIRHEQPFFHPRRVSDFVALTVLHDWSKAKTIFAPHANSLGAGRWWTDVSRCQYWKSRKYCA